LHLPTKYRASSDEYPIAGTHNGPKGDQNDYPQFQKPSREKVLPGGNTMPVKKKAVKKAAPKKKAAKK